MLEKNFIIDTELSSGHLEEALDFLRDFYLLPQPDSFKNISRTIMDGAGVLSYTATNKQEGWEVRIEIQAENPFLVKIIPLTTPPDFDISPQIDLLEEELFIAIQAFEDAIRQATLYFAWVEGEEILPEAPPTRRKKVSFRIFGSNMIMIYLLFFGINIIIFILLELVLAIMAILLFQLVIVLFSDRILLRTSDWIITPENPRVHILEYQLPLEEFQKFQEKFDKDIIIKMKDEIYQKSLALGLEPTCELGEDVFREYGFHCQPDLKVSRVIDVYSIVKEAASKFNINMPKVALSNTMIPNAAATGPSPNRGLVLITTGLLVQLEEDEILSVVGHEMGHLSGRDPIILFSIISAEFILRFTILFPLVAISPLVYLIVALGFIFFVAKFFETRADLLSAMKIGHPQVLASALRKIGYQRLHAERISPTRLPSWINFDPHPPIYFRIDRLEGMKTPVKVKNPLLKSAKDVVDGFKRTLGL
ncbi:MULTISPECIES: M48 family metallopeptidase [Methanobacterium]|mgnify:CR=1 FL=1|jgi:heat shock protein HtpX|uniref:M48 family metalloprotease n=1 Tax=Methanobacterium subterraneum TaxID=59277 RepID=A0A7K4DJ01_9EURY|nr:MULTISPECIES: M48 family metallopeptidase [Methanobacterium]AUB58738.1 heat-shock protein HtpX [Methanobacterium sp. MZ-A1]MBW4257434.1 M48 family metalloprotease [Methanobacterium sp. YSL]NMO08278.1 M48 family metalloprotease [Methanobacterium subterraneum]